MAIYSIEEIMRSFRFAVKHISDDAQKIWVNKRSYRIPKSFPMLDAKGTDCKVCGRKGVHFESYRLDNRDHLRLITETPGVYITVEHTTPRAAGGSNHRENLEPTCSHCNSRWKNKFDKELKERCAGVSVNRRNEYLIIIE